MPKCFIFCYILQTDSNVAKVIFRATVHLFGLQMEKKGKTTQYIKIWWTKLCLIHSEGIKRSEYNEQAFQKQSYPTYGDINFT